MVLPGHIAGGYLVTRALLALAPASALAALTPGQVAALLIVGTLAGEAPDIDLFWYSFKHLALKSHEEDDHREYVTHAPALWLIGSLILIAAGALASDVFVQFLGWVILGGSWTHFIFDSIEHGVMWLWPFSKRRYCLRDTVEPDIELAGKPGTPRRYWSYIRTIYVKRITFYVEIVVTVAAILILLHTL